MVYLTQMDIEGSGGGYTYSDMKKAGVAMTASEWETYCDQLINAITAAINTFCRVHSFEAETYTEVHDGRGANGEYGDYLERDRIYLLRETPVISITSVKEDVAAKSAVPSWTSRTVRSALAAGDYEVLKRGSVSMIRFHQNVPAYGTNNVQIVYVAGYQSFSEQLDDIRSIALQMADNHLARKKSLQERNQARQNATKDAAEMFHLDPDIMTEDIQLQLKKYQRQRSGARQAWR